MPAVKAGAQRRSSPTNKSPQGQSMQTGNPRAWPADVFCLANEMFVKNMIELPTFKNQVISYPKLHHFRLLENIFKKARDLGMLGSCSRTETALRGGKQLPPHTEHGTRDLRFSRRRGVTARVPEPARQARCYLSSATSSRCGLGPITAPRPQFPHL